jgi:hypothetical protein
MSCENAETLCLIWKLIEHVMTATDSLFKGLWYMHCILFIWLYIVLVLYTVIEIWLDLIKFM